jgi:hypothetical protein
MNDLVKRLLDRSKAPDQWTADALMNEAADEIERLQAELARLTTTPPKAIVENSNIFVDNTGT